MTDESVNGIKLQKMTTISMEPVKSEDFENVLQNLGMGYIQYGNYYKPGCCVLTSGFPGISFVALNWAVY